MTVLHYPDACPVCQPGFHGACLPLAPPQAVPGGSVAPYEHAACGTSWRTRFDRHGWPVDRVIAPVTPVQAAENLATLRRVTDGRAA